MPSLSSGTRVLVSLLASLGMAQGGDFLVPQKPVLLKGTKGKFDFITVDAERRRLLAAHTGNASLEIVDLDTSVLLKSIPTGAAQDCAIDPEGKRYIVSVSKPPRAAIIDAERLLVLGTVPLEGRADLLAWSAATHRAYLGHDDGAELWILDAGEKKVTGKIRLPSEAPEGLAFDAEGKRLFQAMKTTSVLCVIDVASQKVAAQWSTLPAAAPHGIVLIPEANAIAVAGGNGKLVLMGQEDGQILSTGDMPERVDQIAYDAELNRVYCATALGKIAAFSIKGIQLEKLGELTTSQGAKSMAVDPKTHQVWTAYSQGDNAFVQAFAVPR